ncbi:TetR/AcrR family transcriptional regulator [Clostridium sp. AM58-1XD]|uniref:TetR/AcrR family transcriptional regulator n=1 Tax=Clostridium sp. AM58-1XD TaxID=2292307 RepID=UPI001A9A58F0|nr:TetR/AcrR family transcriptional regulator [Clostridium sp. AM58-1XD]
MTNRQLAALETKKKLLDAAKKIICEKGLVNTSIGEITQACGVSNGTFYTYFKQKEDVLFALSREMFKELFEKARDYNGTFMERLVFFMISFSGYIEKGSLKLCQEWVRNTVNPDLVENPDDKNKLNMDIDSIKGLIESGIKKGELQADTPVDVLAHTLTDVLYGEMLCWNMSGGAYSFESRTREFCDTFLSAIIVPYLIRKEDNDYGKN